MISGIRLSLGTLSITTESEGISKRKVFGCSSSCSYIAAIGTNKISMRKKLSLTPEDATTRN